MFTLQKENKKFFGKQRDEQGFSAIEIIVTVAIVGVLAAIAIPSLLPLVISSRSTTQANQFISSMNFARSEAVKRNQRVTACVSSDGATCDGAGDWEKGWIVFVDPNNNAVVDTGEEILQVNDALGGKSTLVGNGNVASYISFVGTGATRLTTDALQMGNATLTTDSEQVTIMVHHTGRVRLEK